MRPLLRRELKQNTRNVLRIIDHNTIIFDPFDDEFSKIGDSGRNYERCARKNLKMSFDRVFGTEATNADIFQFALRPLVTSALKGYNCCAFVYGINYSCQITQSRGVSISKIHFSI